MDAVHGAGDQAHRRGRFFLTDFVKYSFTLAVSDKQRGCYNTLKCTHKLAEA